MPGLRILFWLLLAVLVFLFLASATGMLIQVSRTSQPPGLKGNINALIIGVSYILLAVISTTCYLGRALSDRRALSKILVPDYDPLAGQPSSVKRHVQKEFLRSIAISHASLPELTARPGWGMPGTKFADIRFRRALLDTLVPLDALCREVLPHLVPLQPRTPLMKHFEPFFNLFSDQDMGRTCLQTYIQAIEAARADETNLTEAQFVEGMQACGQFSKLLDEYKQAVTEGRAPHSIATEQ